MDERTRGFEKIMSEYNNTEVFTTEFRHETVEKFVWDLVEGKIRLMFPPNLESELGSGIVKAYGSLSNNIVRYASGKESKELNELEKSIFSDIVVMLVSGAIISNNINSSVDNEIQTINKKIDSTNTLLHQIMIVLLEITKRLDKQ